ncbi:MAG: hypothetical protein HYT11_00755, partial [Candidatus Levybacteria bacterium]|nr:hypothetical protein [Candidatus Levybacteria bacterium]
SLCSEIVSAAFTATETTVGINVPTAPAPSRLRINSPLLRQIGGWVVVVIFLSVMLAYIITQVCKGTYRLVHPKGTPCKGVGGVIAD